MKHWRGLTLLLALVAALALAAGCAQAPAQTASPAKVDPLVKGVEARATWVGMLYNGFITTSGEQFDMRKLTAAHATLPYGTRLEVLNPANGKHTVVVINDRRNLDGGMDLALSEAAAKKLDLYGTKRSFTVFCRYAK